MNIKSSYWDGVHVDAFCDLNSTPIYGCSEIFSPRCAASIASSPNSEMNTLYWLESDVNTIAHSCFNGI